MMPTDMPQDAHGDAPQDMDMIKMVLQKFIDEMDNMDAAHMMPADKRPMPVEAKMSVDAAGPETGMMGDDESNGDLDPAVLSQLMDKAGQADADGALPEDHEDDLPPELSALVKMKKKPM